MRGTKEIPKGWAWCKLPQIAQIVMGQSPPSTSYNTEEKGLPFFQGKTEFRDIYPTPVKWCNSPKKTSEKDDILISVRAPVGPTNLSPTKACIGRGLAAIHPEGGIPPIFLLYYFRIIEPHLASKGTGSTFEAISKKHLQELDFPFPPLNEQQHIVDKIEALLSQVNASHEKLAKVLDIMKQFRQSVLAAAFSGRLTEQWRKEHPDIENASVLLEKIEKERKEKFGKKYEELERADNANVLEGWMWIKIKNICNLVNGKAFKPSEWASKGLPIIRIQNLNNLEKRFNYCDFDVDEKYYIKDGDLLFAWSGTPGTSFGAHIWNRGKAVLNQHIFKVEIDEKYLSRHFMKGLFNYNVDEYIRKAHGTAGLSHITKKKFEESFGSIPPLTEQHEIVRQVEALFKQADEIEKRVATATQSAEQITQSILAKAFRGELVPQDPNDEPASVLLERIKTDIIMS